jgi:hypothetical protein
MNIKTLEEAARYGIAHEHPDHPSRRGDTPPAFRCRVDGQDAPSLADVTPSSRLRLPTKNDKGQNRTEARFDAFLGELERELAIGWYAFEPMKFRLAGRTWYTPDFMVRLINCRLVAVDVKGFMRDDAAVKLKVFAATYPFIPLYVVKEVRRVFQARLVTPSGGISRAITPEWWRCL